MVVIEAHARKTPVIARDLGALPELIAAVNDMDPNVRIASADAISRLGEKAAPALSALIKAGQAADEHPHVLRSIVAALGAIGPAAAPALPLLLGVSALGGRGVPVFDDIQVGAVGHVPLGLLVGLVAVGRALAQDAWFDHPTRCRRQRQRRRPPHSNRRPVRQRNRGPSQRLGATSRLPCSPPSMPTST